MRQRYFITATGTGIGKSFITAALARQAKAAGKSVAAYKPVISGFDPAKPIEESDTRLFCCCAPRPAFDAVKISNAFRPGVLRNRWRLQWPRDWKIARSISMRWSPRARNAMNGAGGSRFDRRRRRRNGPPHRPPYGHRLDRGAGDRGGAGDGQLSRRHQPYADGAGRIGAAKNSVFAVIVNESAESPVPLQATVDNLRWSLSRVCGHWNAVSELRGAYRRPPPGFAGKNVATCCASPCMCY